MPLLGALFARRPQRSTATLSSTTSPSASQSNSQTHSPTSEYVAFSPASAVPSSPNGRGPSTPSPRGLFGRKRSVAPLDREPASPSALAPPRPRLSTSAASEADLDAYHNNNAHISGNTLRPPAKAGLFSTSTRSLPPPRPTSPEHSHSHSNLNPTRHSPTKSTKSVGRRFFWSRGKKPPASPTSPQFQDEQPASFNLKAFRHVGPSSGGRDVSPSRPGARDGDEDEYAPPVRLRPRGTSGASEASRISVAAFREMQARRSLAGSPAPGEGGSTVNLNANSYAGSTGNLHGAGTGLRAPSPGPYGRTPPPLPTKMQTRSRSRVWDSDDEDESDSNANRYARSKSEMGHTHVREGANGGGRGREGNGGQVYGVSGASASNGYLGAPAYPQQRPQPQPAQQPRVDLPFSAARAHAPSNSVSAASASTSDSGSESSDSEEDDSDDDAPLAMLVAPRRPGSALSHSSTASLQRSLLAPKPSQASLAGQGPSVPPKTTGAGNNNASGNKPKPLIDITALTAVRPVVASASRHNDGKDKQAGFTGGGMLASLGSAVAARAGVGMGSNASTSGSAGGGSASASTNTSPVLTSRSPPVRAQSTGLVHFPSPPGSPVAETPPVLRAAAEEQPKRASPMRKETAGSVVSVGASTKEEGPGKRDVLGERLSRAVLAAKEGKDGKEVGKGRSTSLAPGSSTDAPSPPNQTSSPPSTSTSSRTANSPPTTFNPAARKAFHRRSSSDIVSASARAWLDDKDAVDKKPAPTPAWSDDEKDAELGRDLADMLGGAMALVSRTGELSPPRVASGDALADGWEKSKNGDAQERKDKDKDTMAPIVIKQRSPPPAFSVTSRSAHQQARSVSAYGEVAGVRQRSSTLVPMSAAGPGAFGARTGTGSNSGSVHNSNLTSNSNSNSSNSNSKSTSPSNASSNTNSNADSTSGSNTHSSSAAVSSAANLGARAGKGGVAGNATASSPSSSTTHGLRARPRSSTMMSLQPVVASSPSPPAAASSPLSRPARPFAAPRIERNSPASSTGDSSSGPAAPLTPRDGSDFSEGGGWSGGVSGLGRLAHQRRSVSFDFEEEAGGMGKARAKAKAKPRETPVQEEERRRERRRSEAKAAIELGNVINGRGPIADDDDEDDDDDDDDDDIPINQTRAVNPMMGNMAGPMGMGMNNMSMNMPMGMGMNMPVGFSNPPGMQPGWPAWQQQGTPRMLGPAQFMVPPPADPSFYAAHQQAMLIAKQAYQMAVAQQAMAVAGEEWERGSTVGGMGGRGSVYAGSTLGASSPPFGMGMGMQGGGWSPGGGMFPPAPRSMYGGGGARSEYGGGGGGGRGWSSSRSVYGEAFGPSTERYAPRSGSNGNLAAQAKFGGRESGYFPPVPAVPQGQGRRLGPGNPRSRTASQPASPSRGSPVSGAGNRRPPPPPSSWKASP